MFGFLDLAKTEEVALFLENIPNERKEGGLQTSFPFSRTAFYSH